MPKSHSTKSSPRRSDDLFERIVSILEQARGNVVRAVNTNMVTAYWLIGREIVEEIQKGKRRAGYGELVVEDLSLRLTQKFGSGFSATTLQYFRKFYLVYPARCSAIPRPLGAEFGATINGQVISRPRGADSVRGVSLSPPGKESTIAPISSPTGKALTPRKKSYPPGAELPQGFSPHLSWSHYRALMRVEAPEARDFYEQEAIAGGWDKRTLERQIQSFYYERMLKSRNPKKMIREGRSLPIPAASATNELKNPYVLEFLGLPDAAELHESHLERAIITHLQRFLLELGEGFAFVARQKHIRIEEQDRYIDLVFYHCRLNFYLLIDLKVGELTHADVGQMDGYVRMYDDLVVTTDDNPTIGLILCSEKNETVARYSVLNDRKRIFASKYMLFLPTEEQLRQEIEKERRLIEAKKEAEKQIGAQDAE
jgi:predicted nuclease of restriction endonuclease-like (RecB) superfamily